MALSLGNAKTEVEFKGHNVAAGRDLKSPPQMRDRGYGGGWEPSPVQMTSPHGWYPPQPPPAYGGWDGYPQRGESARYA
ncbi:hypothetical protein FOPE_06594 [Fonsecaea pedrosoi]|nr:hypothetical protein FOPE_06594 [Fonsecaea pedrosoi]